MLNNKRMKKNMDLFLNVISINLLQLIKNNNLITKQKKYFQISPSYWALVPVVMLNDENGRQG